MVGGHLWLAHTCQIVVDVQLVGQLQSAITIKLDNNFNQQESDLLVNGFEEIPIPDEDENECQEIIKTKQEYVL